MRPEPSGIAYMAQAAFWFSLMTLVVKLAGQTLPTWEIVFVRAALTLTFTAAQLARLRGQVRWSGTRRGRLLLRGVFGSGGLLCYYFAVDHLPMAEASVIHQTSPLFTALLAAWFLGERLERRVLASIAISLAGVAMIAQAGSWSAAAGPEHGDQRFAFVGLAGSLFAAAAYTTVRFLGGSEHPLVVVLYFPIVTLPISAPFALSVWVWPTALGWLWLLLVGASTQLAQQALTKGLARERAGRATSVGYLQVAFTAVLGVVFFGDWPDLLSVGGIAAILLGLFVGTRSSAPR